MLFRSEPGTYRISAPIRLQGQNFALDGGTKATIHRTPKTTETSIFLLTNVQHARISRFFLEGEFDGSASSTGSNPLIQIGAGAGSDDDSISEDIEISGNHFFKGNLAGVLVEGRQGTIGTVKNRNIRIFDNRFEKVTTGVFIYKNASNVVVSGNYAQDTAVSGYAMDTRAATDPKDTGPNEHIVIANNFSTRTGQAQGFIGHGVLVKGANHDIVVSGNTMTDIGNARTTKENYGILVTQDASGNSPSNVTLRDNSIKEVTSGTTGSYAIYVLRGASKIKVFRNTMSGAKRGMTIGPCEDVLVADNAFANLARLTDYPLTIGDATGAPRGLSVSNNNFSLGDGRAVTPIGFAGGARGTGISHGSNHYAGFAKNALTMSAAPGFAPDAEPAVFAGSANYPGGNIPPMSGVSFSGRVPGAGTEDAAIATLDAPPAEKKLVVTAFVSGSGTVTVNLFNPTPEGISASAQTYNLQVFNMAR